MHLAVYRTTDARAVVHLPARAPPLRRPTPTALSGCITAAAPVPLWCAGLRWGD
ncbi:hypothetical protein ACWDE9_19050 [Streptomyces olivaceoviridis]